MNAEKILDRLNEVVREEKRIKDNHKGDNMEFWAVGKIDLAEELIRHIKMGKFD